MGQALVIEDHRVDATMSKAQSPRRATGRNPLGREVLLQYTVLAGDRHHAAARLWPALRRHAPLTLRREPDNVHDPNAVALYWRGEKLGYLPRRENLVAARLLDHQRQLSARVEGVATGADGHRCIQVAVLMH